MAKYLCFILSFWGTGLMAQNNGLNFSEVQFGLSYLHNGITNPGLQLHAEWVFHSRSKTFQKENRRLGRHFQTSERQFALEGRLGTYWDPLTQWAAFNHYIFSYRFVYRKPGMKQPSWAIALGLGPGYFHSILPETYAVDDQGNVRKIGLAGRGYFSTILDFKFIRERPGKRLSAFFWGLNTFSLYNYNATLAPTNNLYFGFRFQLKSKS